jgi:Cu(I)/Ag(I) efflux system membrane fusion protein
MKTRTLVAVLAAAGVLIALGAYQLGAHRTATVSAGGATGSPAAMVDPKTGRPVLYWHDPMVPGTRFDKPGKSPFMDMQLVPVYADDAGGAGANVSSQVAQRLGIRTGVVRKGAVSSSFEAAGIVTQNERATEVVQSRVTAYVEALHVRALLDPVSKGQPLATLYAPEWAGALEEYLGLRRAQAGAALVEASRARLRLLSIPDEVVAKSEQAGAAQTRFTLNAPISGVVAELGVRDGAMVSPGMTLYRITDLSTVWVAADVPQAVGVQVRPGNETEVRAPGMEDQPYLGKVLAVLPDVDPMTRTLKARIEIRNPALVLKPGMFVRVLVKERSAQPVLLVPLEAVIATGKRNVVIVAGDDGKYMPVEIQPGRESGGDVEIKSGLSEGQRVVLSGQFLLDSEASFKSGLGRLSADASVDIHSAEGRIEAIDKDELTLSHGPIESLKWGAMTMPFKNPRQGLPKDLKVGMRVKFDFIQQGDDYVLQSVTPLPAGAKP